MKLNIFNSIIAIAISVFIGWALSSMHFDDGNYRAIVSVGCSITMIVTLLPAIALRLTESSRTSASMRITSILFAILALIGHIFFGIFSTSITTYIITIGLALMIYALILKKLVDASIEV